MIVIADWARYKRPYPHVYKWLRGFYDRMTSQPRILEEYLKHARCYTTLDAASGKLVKLGNEKYLRVTHALNTVGWFQAPQIEYSDASRYCSQNGVTYGVTIISIATVFIHPSILAFVEQELSSSNKQYWQLIAEATLMHEFVHWELHENGEPDWEHSSSDSDQGKAFERAAYGKVIEPEGAEYQRLLKHMGGCKYSLD